jgi:hypothetical protein
MNFTLNTPESTQESTFQNATLHGINDKLACSIAITPTYPDHIKTQAQAEEYLKNTLRALDDLGWDVDVQIGLSRDYEDYDDPEMFDDMEKTEVFELLKSHEEIITLITDHWCDNNEKWWEDSEISQSILEILKIDINTKTKAFEFIREFYNQQLMFEMIAYKNDIDYQRCEGENLTSELFTFLHELKDQALRMNGIFNNHEFIKVRSLDGNYSELTSDITELWAIEL